VDHDALTHEEEDVELLEDDLDGELLSDEELEDELLEDDEVLVDELEDDAPEDGGLLAEAPADQVLAAEVLEDDELADDEALEDAAYQEALAYEAGDGSEGGALGADEPTDSLDAGSRVAAGSSEVPDGVPALPALSTTGGAAPIAAVQAAGLDAGRPSSADQVEVQRSSEVHDVGGTHRYHAASCRYLTGKASQAQPLADAVAAGLQPCAVCSPPSRHRPAVDAETGGSRGPQDEQAASADAPADPVPAAPEDPTAGPLEDAESAAARPVRRVILD
jgi:hypothetical protein